MMAGCDHNRVDGCVAIDALLGGGTEFKPKLRSSSLRPCATQTAQAHHLRATRFLDRRNQCTLSKVSRAQNTDSNLGRAHIGCLVANDFQSSKRLMSVRRIANQNSEMRFLPSSCDQLVSRGCVLNRE